MNSNESDNILLIELLWMIFFSFTFPLLLLYYWISTCCQSSFISHIAPLIHKFHVTILAITFPVYILFYERVSWWVLILKYFKRLNSLSDRVMCSTVPSDYPEEFNWGSPTNHHNHCLLQTLGRTVSWTNSLYHHGAAFYAIKMKTLIQQCSPTSQMFLCID